MKTKKIKSVHTHKERESLMEHMMEAATEAIMSGNAIAANINIYAKDKTVTFPLGAFKKDEASEVAMVFVIATSLSIYNASSYMLLGKAKRNKAEILLCTYVFRDCDIASSAIRKVIRKNGHIVKFSNTKFIDATCSEGLYTNLFKISKDLESGLSPEKVLMARRMIEENAHITPIPPMH
jgi:hypothetical protein